jgi:methylmalonyl-CoA mutase N-terminal domain/subunit
MTEERKDPKTSSGIAIKSAYTKSDLVGSCDELPGLFPYTRGIHPTMYRGKPWTMRQYAGFGSADDTNARYHFLLKQGITGLSVAFDLPTQMGRDPDHPLARGEVGRVGVSVPTVEVMERLVRGIPLDQVSISMTINATAGILLAFLLVVAERRGIGWSSLRGTIQNDLLKEYMARGTYIYPPKPAMRIVTDIFAFCKDHVPQWNTISVSGYHIREAGSTAVEELAFTLADGLAYLKAAVDSGLSVDDVAPRMAFFFNCHNDFFEEISKFRAARRLWAKLVRERFNPKDERALLLRFHTQTAGSTLTAQQPHNNIIRTTIQALSAVLGGTQSLHTNGFDEALGLPTEDSARLALRTQQIIAEESGVARAADPLGGSYLIEALTSQLEQQALKRIETIDAMGGMLDAIEQRYPQGEIENSAYEAQRAIESGDSRVVGVNVHVEGAQSEPPILNIDPAVEAGEQGALAAFKQSRDESKVKESLTRLQAVAQGLPQVAAPGALMAITVECVRNSCTLGEISDTLRAVFGEYHSE